MITLDKSSQFVVPYKDQRCLITFPKEDYLILNVSVPVNYAGSRFEHENILIKSSHVAEYKHYRANGSKYWTAKAAIKMYFAFRKKDIILEQDQCGFSFVRIKIGEAKPNIISCSGCSGHDGYAWYDTVSQGAYLCGDGWSQKRLKELAELAMTPEECNKLGITGDCQKLLYNQYYMELVASQEVKLKEGMKVVLEQSYSFCGEHGPFIVMDKIRKHWRAKGHGISFAVYRKQIDWLKTAKANEIQLTPPVYYNRLENVFL